MQNQLSLIISHVSALQNPKNQSCEKMAYDQFDAYGRHVLLIEQLGLKPHPFCKILSVRVVKKPANGPKFGCFSAKIMKKKVLEKGKTARTG